VFALADRITVLVYGASSPGAPAIRATPGARAYLGDSDAVAGHVDAPLSAPGVDTCYGRSQVLFGLCSPSRARW
jgi:hypothetical protein